MNRLIVAALLFSFNSMAGIGGGTQNDGFSTTNGLLNTGALGVPAAVTIQRVKFTAIAPGVAGNSITVAFNSVGFTPPATASAIGNAITITAGPATALADIKQAVANSYPVSQLVSVSGDLARIPLFYGYSSQANCYSGADNGDAILNMPGAEADSYTLCDRAFDTSPHSLTGGQDNPFVTLTQTTAAAPISCRLSDGSAFYTASGGSGGGGGDGAILDGTTATTKAKVTGSSPGSGDNGLVTRNIPSGIQDVTNTGGLMATSANQTSANTKLDTLHTDLGLLATASAQTTGNSSLSTIATNTGNGATASNQTSELTKLDTLHSDNSAATATMTQVSVTASNTSLLASNASRKKCIIYNDGTVIAYVALGATATTGAYSFQMKPLAYFECSRPIYTGAISAITASGTATLKVTEIQ